MARDVYDLNPTPIIPERYQRRYKIEERQYLEKIGGSWL